MHPILCVVLDVAGLGRDPSSRARSLFAAGADWVQLRDRQVDDQPLFETARALVQVRDERDHPSPDPKVVINRRADVALAAGADGVHLGFDGLPPAIAARLLGSGALIGCSLHAPSEFTAAAKAGAHYAHLAPIWDPFSKPATRPALGPEALQHARRTPLPILAQGGVDPERAARAIEAGAAGIAVSGLLAAGAEARAVLKPLRASLDKAAQEAGVT